MNALVDHKAFASPADAAATSASTAVSLFDFTSPGTGKGHQIRVWRLRESRGSWRRMFAEPLAS